MGKFLCYQTGEKSQAVLFTFRAKASVLDDHEQGRQHHRESLSQRCYQYKDITHVCSAYGLLLRWYVSQ